MIQCFCLESWYHMKYFTINRAFFLVPSIDIVKEYEKIDKFMTLLENSEVGKIIKSVKKKDEMCKGRIGYNPYNLFAAIVYCFAKFKGTLRDIEDKCQFDVRVYYIMEGNVPNYSTICLFINKYILPYQYEIFTLINKQIIRELHLNIDNVYKDGTKFEANANKYKFVWKPIKFHERLDKKIKDYIANIGYDVEDNKLTKSNDFNEILNNYANQNNINIYDIPRGIGCKRTLAQRVYLLGYNYLIKLLEYEEKEEICGDNRNSYFKTDHDATAMVLKEDYYSRLSHDFHAGYNIQVMVSSLLILMYGIFQDRSDHYTFIPMDNKFKLYYGFYPKNECADAGYGIYSNYQFMKEHNIGNYVKYQYWDGESTGKHPRLFKVDKDDNVVCLNSKIGTIHNVKTHPKIKDSKFYIFEGCNSCGYSYKCKEYMKEENKNNDYRIKELSVSYEHLKDEAMNNLLSPKGIEIRINRSIQVEGTFGQIKRNMNYERIRRRGMDKVSCEIMLMCLGVNIRRYFISLDNNKFKNNCWNTPDTLQPEIFPSVKQKKKN